MEPTIKITGTIDIATNAPKLILDWTHVTSSRVFLARFHVENWSSSPGHHAYLHISQKTKNAQLEIENPGEHDAWFDLVGGMTVGLTYPQTGTLQGLTMPWNLDLFTV